MIHTRDKEMLLAILRSVQLTSAAVVIHHTPTNTVFRFGECVTEKRRAFNKNGYWNGGYVDIPVSQVVTERAARLEKVICAIKRAPAYLWETNRRTRKGVNPKLLEES